MRLTLVEKAEAAIKEEDAEAMTKRLLSAKFDFNDFLKQYKMDVGHGQYGQHHEDVARSACPASIGLTACALLNRCLSEHGLMLTPECFWWFSKYVGSCLFKSEFRRSAWGSSHDGILWTEHLCSAEVSITDTSSAGLCAPSQSAVGLRICHRDEPDIGEAAERCREAVQEPLRA